MMVKLEIIAFIGSFMGVGGSLPQIFKIIKTGDTQALAWSNYILIFFSSICWISYGFIDHVYSMIFWSSFSLLTSATILTLKLKNEGFFLQTGLVKITAGSGPQDPRTDH